MKLPAHDLSNRVRWLISLRWLACAGVVLVVWLTSAVLKIVPNPVPLYLVALAMLVYNSLFRLNERSRRGGSVDRNILLQITLDQIALTLLLYFSGLSHNPFIFYFVFHMIIASLLLPGRVPYFLAGLASCLVGLVMLLGLLGWIPLFELKLPHIVHILNNPSHETDGIYLLGLFIAFASTLWITVYFTTSVRRYVHRAQAEVRQKEKMLGIGQLVAGIAHQISNPLDGLQNCLRTLGKGVEDDEHLTQYVKLMSEALDRIERTATRVQAFARPHGLKLQETEVNKAVEATIPLLGESREDGVEIATELGNVPLVKGDPYTLQEVIFNLCTNALAAMPNGGELIIRTFPLEVDEFGQLAGVAIEVADTGVGIPTNQLEKIFEPFYTTRAETGGTGLGLGLCRMLISEMGGWIEVSSVVNQGTTFRVSLVMADKQAEAVEDENPGS